MKTVEDARRLAQRDGRYRYAGRPADAGRADGDGRAAGHGRRATRWNCARRSTPSKGRGPSDLTELSSTLAAHMLVVGQSGARSRRRRGARVDEAIRSGAAFDRFRSLVEHQGGDVRVIDDWEPACRGPSASRPWRRQNAGYVVGHSRRTASAARRCCSARAAPASIRPIDYGAGVVLRVKPGDRVNAGAPLAELHVGRQRPARRGAFAAGSKHSSSAIVRRRHPRSSWTSWRERPPLPPIAHMPNDRSLRFACAGVALVLAVAAYALQGTVDPRVQAFAGIVCFILIVAAVLVEPACGQRADARVGHLAAVPAGAVHPEVRGLRRQARLRVLQCDRADGQALPRVHRRPGRRSCSAILPSRTCSARCCPMDSSSRSRRCRRSSSSRRSSRSCTTSASCSASSR